MDRILAIVVLLCVSLAVATAAAVPEAKDDLKTSEFFWGGWGYRPWGWGPWGYGGFGGYPYARFGGFGGYWF